jgi:hypothetical protein
MNNKDYAGLGSTAALLQFTFLVIRHNRLFLLRFQFWHTGATAGVRTNSESPVAFCDCELAMTHQTIRQITENIRAR